VTSYGYYPVFSIKAHGEYLHANIIIAIGTCNAYQDPFRNICLQLEIASFPFSVTEDQRDR
jgi:hypothetical protein